MKPRNIHHPLFLLALLLVAGGFSAKAQVDSCVVNVIHTYMNGRLIPWDSVEVQVQDAPNHSHSFKMYWPDTLLNNCPTGINEYLPNEDLGFSQNFPNPCQGESRVLLTTRTAGSVRLQVMDVQGRLCCQRTETLAAGEHALSLTFPHSGLYFVTAETAEDRATCKVLCSEGKGSAFDIRLSSTSPQMVEKAERGGEGLFGMTDYMRIIAYITYNGEVRSNGWVVNYTSEIDGVTISLWMYQHGSINIHFDDIDSCDHFELSGKSFNVLADEMCLPTMDYPVVYHVTFYDSTFYSEPTSLSDYSSPTWLFSGWYKYRYYPEDLGGCICVATMDNDLPQEPLPYMEGYWTRKLDVLSCDAFKLDVFAVNDHHIQFFVSN